MLPNRLRGSQVPRPREEIVQALRDHVRLLGEYITKAFVEGDEAYLGEVAAKLRLLATETGQNKPLLLDVMDAVGFRYEIEWKQWDVERATLPPSGGPVIVRV